MIFDNAPSEQELARAAEAARRAGFGQAAGPGSAPQGYPVSIMNIPGGSPHELVSIDEGKLYGDRVVATPCGSDEHSGAIQGPESKRGSRPIGYGAKDQKKNSPLDETLEHMISDTSR